MPDQAPPGSETPRFRVIGRYADDVTPPLVAGNVVSRTEYATREEADIGIEELVGRTDIGRITLSMRTGLGDREGWLAMHTWTRTGTGWRYQA